MEFPKIPNILVHIGVLFIFLEDYEELRMGSSI